jgi:hypothetical protein
MVAMAAVAAGVQASSSMANPQRNSRRVKGAESAAGMVLVPLSKIMVFPRFL